MKKFFNLFLSVVFASTTAVPRAFADSDSPEKFRLDFQSTSDVSAIEFETFTVDSVSEASEKITEVLAQDNNRAIVSSALPAILKTAANFPKKVALLPIAEAVEFAKDRLNSANEILRSVRESVIKTAKIDKLGLAIVTYRIGTDVVRWVHADDLSSFAKTTGLVYLVVSTVLLGIDKDSWSNYIEPIEKKWTKILKFSANTSEHTGAQKTLVSYLSNATGATILNVGFIPILAFDRIAQGNAASLAAPVLMGLLTTASAFSWFEFFKAIDERESPRAKAVSRFLLNSRSIAIASVASTVMLLNNQSYGATPWIVLTVSGVVGLPFMLKAQKIADWIERSPILNKVSRLYSSANSVFKRKKIATASVSELVVCKDVFVRSAAY